MRCASLLNPGLPLQRYLFWSNCAFWTTRLVSVCCVGFCNGFSSSTIFSGGSRGAPPPPHLSRNWGPKGRNIFLRPDPPYSQGLDDRPPSLIWRSGSVNDFRICHKWYPRVDSFQNRKIIKFFGLRAVTVSPKINFIHGYNQVVNWSLIDIMGGFRGGAEWAAPPFSVKFPIIFKEFPVK